MEHRRLLRGSLIAVPLGLILWTIVGPSVSLGGITYRWEGTCPRCMRTTTEYTTTFWIGIVVSNIGLVILIVGVAGAILVWVLESLRRQHKTRLVIPTRALVAYSAAKSFRLK